MASGVDKLKDAMGMAVEPAMVFAETGSAAASTWSLLGTILATKILGPLSLITGGLMAMNGAMKLFLGRTEAVAKGVEKIRQLELIQTQFQPLLGGAEAAKKRLEELFTFASSTPFQLAEIAEASRTLEVLTKGAFSSQAALRLVGDAAAVSGQSMQTVAFWIGRTYDALKSGAPIGEATARLQEMGLITGEVRRKLQESAAAGEAFSSTMFILEKALQGSSGGMEQLSQTLGGLESTLADVRAKFAAGFAEDFAAAEKMQVKALINTLNLLEPVASAVGEYMAMVSKALSSIGLKATEALGSFKGLGNILGNITSVFLTLATAVLSVQFAGMIASLFGLNKLLGITTGLTQALTLAQIRQQTAGMGIIATMRAMTAAMAGTTAAVKLQTLVGSGLVGAYKAIAMVLGMVRAAFASAFAVLAKSPVTWVVVAAASFAKYRENVEKAANRLKEFAAANEQARDKIDEMVKSMKNMDDRDSSLSKITTEIESLTQKTQEFAKQMGELTAFDTLMGGKIGMEAEFEEARNSLQQLLDTYMSVIQVDARRLELLKAHNAQLERQVALAKDLSDQEFEFKMEKATAPEKILLLDQRQQQIEGRARVGLDAEESSKKGEALTAISSGVGLDLGEFGLDTEELESGIAKLGELNSTQIETLKNILQAQLNESKGVALTSETESLQSAKEIAEFGQSLSDLIENTIGLSARPETKADQQNRIEELRQALENLGDNNLPTKDLNTDQATKISGAFDEVNDLRTRAAEAIEAGDIDGLKDILAQIKDAIRNLSVDLKGGRAIDGDVIKALRDDDGKITTESLEKAAALAIEKGASAGLLTALKSSKLVEGNDFSPRDKETINQSIKTLETAKEDINSNLLETGRIRNRIREGGETTVRSTELLRIERERGAALRKIDPDKEFEAQRKSLQIDLNAAEQVRDVERVPILESLGRTKDARDDAEQRMERAKTARNALQATSTEDFSTEDLIAYNQKVKELDDELKSARDTYNISNDAIANLNAELMKLNDPILSLEDALRKLAERVEKFKRELEESLEIGITRAEAESAFQNDDLGRFEFKTKDAMEMEDARDDRQFLERAKAAGLSEDDAEAALDKFREKRDAERQARQDGIKRGAALDLVTADLGAKARDGDSKARNELAAIEGNERFRQVFREAVEAGMGKDEAQKTAMQAADATLLNKMGTTQMTVDSARRIGAGGFATSSDPMKALAERRLRMLEKINDGIMGIGDSMIDQAANVGRFKLR